MTTRKKLTAWEKIKKNWFGLTVALVGLIHSYAMLAGKIDLNTAGGSFSTFIVALVSVKSALKDDNE
jgi:hypothetical protein